MKITESMVKKQIIRVLNMLGWFHFHIIQGIGSYPGVPDRIAMKNGIVLFIEVKKPGGSQSAGQILFQHNTEKAMCHYLLIDDAGKLIEYIRKIENAGTK